jgi:hypothetical protein
MWETMTPMTNLLSKLLIVPSFVPQAECRSVVDALKQRPIAILGVGDDAAIAQEPLDPAPTFADVTSAEATLRALKTSAIAQAVILPRLGDRSIIEKLSRFTDVTPDLAQTVLRGFATIIDDIDLYAGLQDRLPIATGSRSAHALEYLATRGALERRDGRWAVTDAARRSEPLQLALRWLNIELLEEVVLPGAFIKQNRALRRGDPRSTRPPDPASLAPLAETLRAAGGQEVAAALVTGDHVDLSWAVREAVRRPTLRRALVEHHRAELERSQPERAGAALAALAACTEAQRPAREAQIAVMVLAAFLPDRVDLNDAEAGGNRGRAVIRSIRSTKTTDFSDYEPSFNAHIKRFVSEHIEPFYGIHATHIQNQQLLRYDASDFYLPHNDSERLVEDDSGRHWVKVKDNDVAIVVYLSDSSDYDGGMLAFPELHVLVQPQQGMAVAFPGDRRFLHAALQVQRGTRWAIATWVSCKEGAPLGTRDQQVAW